ncbi:MAG TPA: proprotein convertase P-domain-containing protein [Kofleriaceae bacterium]
MLRVAVIGLVVAACGFEHGAAIGDGGAIDSPPVFDDGGHEVRTWQFVTAQDWATAGYTTQEMAIHPSGMLTPSGFVYGGLLAHGVNSALWSHADPSLDWSQTTTTTPSGAGLWRGTSLAAGTTLSYYGVNPAGATTFTLWLEGEVDLPAGTVQVDLTADDAAFVDLAEVGATTYTRFGQATQGGQSTVTMTLASSGWHPIRIGWSSASATGAFTLLVNGAPLVRNQMRADGAGIAGTLRDVFAHEIFAGGPNDPQLASGRFPVSRFVALPVYADDNFATAPYGSGGGAKDWSMRMAGQVYVATAGAYQFQVASDDGNQLVVGSGPPLSNSWTRDAVYAATSTLSTTLDVGWNDLQLDYNQVSGALNLELLVAASSDPALVVGQPIPQLAVRGTEPPGDRLATGADLANHSVPDNGGTMNTATCDLSVSGFAGELVSSIDVSYQLNSPHTNQLGIDLQRPDGTRVQIKYHDGTLANNADDFVEQTANSTTFPSLVGGPADGAWALRIYDDQAAGGASSVKSAYITLHTTGAGDSLAHTGTWTSNVLDNATALYAIDDLTWNEHDGAGGAPAQVFLRTCDQADCSDHPPWGDALAQHARPALAMKRYMQAMVVLSTDGRHDSELTDLVVTFRRYASD